MQKKARTVYKIEEVSCNNGETGCGHCFVDIVAVNEHAERHISFLYNECENCGDGCGNRKLR